MKSYIVDISHLSVENKKIVHDKIDGFAFICSYIPNPDGPSNALQVICNNIEEFTIPILPLVCPYHEI